MPCFSIISAFRSYATSHYPTVNGKPQLLGFRKKVLSHMTRGITLLSSNGAKKNREPLYLLKIT